MRLIDGLKSKFEEVFGKGNQDVFFAPGRINLMGEHTSENGGNIFLCPISLGTYMISRKREDRKIRMFSSNFEHLGITEFSIDNLNNNESYSWCNCSKGVIDILKNRGIKIENGFDALVFEEINGYNGLSSGATLEVVTALMLRDLFNLDIDMINIAKILNEDIGANCRMSDYFPMVMWKKHKAILLDANKLKYQYVDFKLDGVKLVIGKIDKRGTEIDSIFRERRLDCENALVDLQKVVYINSLGELTEQEFKKYSYAIDDELRKNRAKYIICENRRTIKATSLLDNNDIEGFGTLINESHNSLRYDYEVTDNEIDSLIDIAQKQKGFIGAKIIGAGFGNSIISLVKEENVENFIKNIEVEYKEAMKKEVNFHVIELAHRARKL